MINNNSIGKKKKKNASLALTFDLCWDLFVLHDVLNTIIMLEFPRQRKREIKTLINKLS